MFLGIGEVFLADVGLFLESEDEAGGVFVDFVDLAADAVVVVVQEGDFHDLPIL